MTKEMKMQFTKRLKQLEAKEYWTLPELRRVIRLRFILGIK